MKRILKWCKRAVIFFFASSIFMVLLYRFVPVYVTPLMVIKSIENLFDGKPCGWHHTWTPLEEINRNLPQAVIASEDNLFLRHNGFDFEQIKNARDEAKRGKRVRGASTISQQTAKNVFLWNGKSYIRKGLEAYFTMLIEIVWGKERIMEVYLNSIEMGENIYGAEAVAQEHFGKSASKLTKAQSALIAASLPNPIRFNSAHPSAYMYRRQAKIMSLMGKTDQFQYTK